MTAPRSPIRVLLVDDHALLRQSLRRVLRETGLEVAGEAADGEEALRLVAETEPDVVLMDVTMPVLDGIEATRRVRRLRPDLPVVVLTMHDDPELIDSARRAGAVGYLLKDCTIDEVSAVVRRAAGELVDNGGVDARPREATAGLSAREHEVLTLLATGMSTDEVAHALFISAKTVKNHLRSVYGKLGVRGRTEAVVRAARLGIVRLD